MSSKYYSYFLLIENNLCQYYSYFLSSKYYIILLYVNRKQFMSSKYYSYFLLIENNLCHQNITHTFCESKTINVIKILLIQNILFLLIENNLCQYYSYFLSSKYYSYFLSICHVNRKQFMSSKYYSYFLLIENNLCHQNITHTFC